MLLVTWLLVGALDARIVDQAGDRVDALGGWLETPKSFVNLFARYASGIAVYDPLSTPMQIGTVTTASTSCASRPTRLSFARRWSSSA